MKNSYIVLALGALAIFIFSKKYTAGILDKLTYGFGFGNIDLANFKIGLKVKIFNPTPLSITIDAIFGTVNSKTESIFDFFENNSVTIKPGQNEIEIFAIPQLGTIITNFSKLLEEDLTIKYTITSGPLAFKNTMPLL